MMLFNFSYFYTITKIFIIYPIFFLTYCTIISSIIRKRISVKIINIRKLLLKIKLFFITKLLNILLLNDCYN